MNRSSFKIIITFVVGLQGYVSNLPHNGKETCNFIQRREIEK